MEKKRGSFLDYKYWYVKCQYLKNWKKWSNVEEWSSIWPKSAASEIKFLSTNNKIENQQAARRPLHQAV